ncbi:hypothetical protein [Parendozoicomonas sp. Alg238-R29]|uniref:hypothetical protein n=1 Tax=Parendozoicomonas sp. Alg238-R29 TaxID=2993446 RepID=UPI00248E9BF0|nr:hypothetical protein [Parendozoicomonas sp. Alg238-R29]
MLNADKALCDHEEILWTPGLPEVTLAIAGADLAITGADLAKVLEKVGNPVFWL